MSKNGIQKEIDQNLAFFRKKLPDLLRDHRNRYALLKGQAVVGIYDTIRDAQTTGDKLYSDKIYSIQKISDEVIDLGFFSHADSVG